VAWAFGAIQLVVNVKEMDSWDLEPSAKLAYNAIFLGFAIGLLIAGPVVYALARFRSWSVPRSLAATEVSLGALASFAVLFAFVK
jgi:ABC-type uncharacterized transport system permease subunit